MSLAAVASRTWRRPQTDTLFAVEGPGAGTSTAQDAYRGQRWMTSETDGSVTGLLADVEPGRVVRGASAFLSEADDPVTFSICSVCPPAGQAAGDLVVVTPRQRPVAVGRAAVAARGFSTGPDNHRFVADGTAARQPRAARMPASPSRSGNQSPASMRAR